MLVVVAYDIPNDRRRSKLARALSDFGTRVQFSVFECRLGDQHLERMLRRVRKLIKPEEDRVRVYRLCRTCEDRILIEGERGTPSWEQEGFLII